MARQPQPVSGMAAQGQASSQAEEEKVPFFRRPAVGNALDSLAIALQGMTLNPNEGLIQLSAGRIADRREAAQAAQQRNRTVEALKQMGADQQLIQLAQSGYGEAALKEMLRRRQPQDMSEKEQRILRLQETGLDRPTAIGVADGRLAVSRNPDTGRAEIIDKATGQIVSQNVAPETNQIVAEMPESEIFGDANVSGALGAQGFGAAALNAITDAIGMGQAAPEIGRAQQALSNLSTRTMLALSAEFPGRPSNLTRERIEAMTVKPGELSTGAQNALNKASEMRRMIEQAYQAAQRAASGEGSLSAQQRTQARQSLSSLEPLLADYIALENSLKTQSGGATLRPDVAERLENY